MRTGGAIQNLRRWRPGHMAVIVLTVWLSGCVGRYHEKYQEFTAEDVSLDYQISQVQPATFRIADWTFSDQAEPALTVSVEQQYSAQQVAFQEHYLQKGGRKDPDVICFIMPFLWFLLVVEPENCFGRTDDWEIYETQRVNLSKVGAPEPRWRKVAAPAIKLELTGLDAESRRLERLTFDVNQNAIEMVPLLEALQIEPNAVAIRMRTTGANPDAVEFVIDQDSLAKLMPAPVWLPVDLAKDKFMLGLRSALIAGDARKANGYFGKLADMPIELPDSFYYRYAVSLSSVGRYDEASQYARRYLALAGEGGAHAQQARALLR